MVLVLKTPDLPAERFTIQDTIRKAGAPLALKSDEALALGLASQVVATDRELWSAFHLKAAPNSEKTTWVDNLVRTLTDPWMSGLLLFVGLFMLILELKLPGVGLPAIISALAFLLFFWSHYLGGTADQLEILLFLVGVVCLALELFVFPGFAVFGLSGILLILASVIMASHTFVWPTNQYEYDQMGRTLMEVTGSIVLVTVGAVLVGRYLPSLPLFRRMILVPVPGRGPDRRGHRQADARHRGDLLLPAGRGRHHDHRAEAHRQGPLRRSPRRRDGRRLLHRARRGRRGLRGPGGEGDRQAGVGGLTVSDLMTIEEIKSRYAPNWVLIVDIESDELQRLRKGRVGLRSPDRDAAWDKADELPRPSPRGAVHGRTAKGHGIHV